MTYQDPHYPPPNQGYAGPPAGHQQYQQYGPSPGFGAPDPNEAHLKDLRNKATIWLIVGIAGLWFGLSFITGPLSWIFGAKLRNQYRALGLPPDGMATGAWIVGIVTTLIWVLAVGMVLLFVFAIGGAALLAA